MVLVVLILLLYSLAPLRTWDIIENDHYNILDRWGYSRVKRHFKIQEKLERDDLLTCEEMYKTKKTPFVAIILYQTSGRFMCFGSIIDHYHILSLNHCFEKADKSEILVLLGYLKAYWGKNSQVKKVQKIVRHEYMLALIRLKSRIEYTSYVQATRLPSSFTKQEIFKKAFPGPYKLVGFEVDRYDTPGDPLTKDLYYVLREDHELPFDECKKNYSKLVLDPAKLFCTIGNATFCWGGRGAPVLKWMKEYYIQIGIVIKDNCTFDTTGPMLVARTDSYSDWIKANSYEKRPR